MKLPHLEPLIFAKEIVSLEDKRAEVICEFQEFPTFGVFIEAAAQSCAAFFQDGEPKTGYLANVVNMELLDSIDQLQYIVTLEEIFCFDTLKKYAFFISEKKEKEKIVVKGEFTVAVE